MLLKIHKQIINNNNIVKTFNPTVVECDQIELDICIIPRLKQLVTVNNLHYNLIGSDNKCRYLIEPFVVSSLNDFINTTVISIDNAINTYNSLVNGVNVDIKRSNKKNNRPVKLGLLNTISIDLVKLGAKGVKVMAGEKGDLIIE